MVNKTNFVSVFRTGSRIECRFRKTQKSFTSAGLPVFWIKKYKSYHTCCLDFFKNERLAIDVIYFFLINIMVRFERRTFYYRRVDIVESLSESMFWTHRIRHSNICRFHLRVCLVLHVSIIWCYDIDRHSLNSNRLYNGMYSGNRARPDRRSTGLYSGGLKSRELGNNRAFPYRVRIAFFWPEKIDYTDPLVIEYNVCKCVAVS